MQHRKQSPVLPTLLLEFKPDSALDKQRKRRSSRTAGLTAKDPTANMLVFRNLSEEKNTIFDWQMNLKPLLTLGDVEESLLSPLSPMVTNFSNPFANRDSARRPSSSAAARPDFFQRSSAQSSINPYTSTLSSRDRPSTMASPSPSLRSRRSDLSSQASSQHPPMGFASNHIQAYSDLPSPASTSTTYDNQFIEGWTSAQGRSSALSSHTRASVASNAPAVMVPTPPPPRESILDRAFQMRYIPGSDREPKKDEEKISSIARFEALMREVDERKQARAVANETLKKTQGWELDEESEESDRDDMIDEEDDGALADDEINMPTEAQRALDYISGRGLHSSSDNRPISPLSPAPPVSISNRHAMSAFLRQTKTDSSMSKSKRPNSLALPSRSISTNAIPTQGNSGGSPRAGDAASKRRSSTSVKRLSFQEFAKRLSSTSSLLLVQTNASSASSARDESDYGYEEEDERTVLRANVMSAAEREKRCAWRGSMVGAEGGLV